MKLLLLRPVWNLTEEDKYRQESVCVCAYNLETSSAIINPPKTSGKFSSHFFFFLLLPSEVTTWDTCLYLTLFSPFLYFYTNHSTHTWSRGSSAPSSTFSGLFVLRLSSAHVQSISNLFSTLTVQMIWSFLILSILVSFSAAPSLQTQTQPFVSKSEPLSLNSRSAKISIPVVEDLVFPCQYRGSKTQMFKQ